MSKEKINKILKELENHDVLSASEDINLLYYIKTLQRENKQLKEKLNTYESPDDMTLMFMWCGEKAKDKIKELTQVLLNIKNI